MPDAVYVRDAFARIADRYVLTNHVLSCGADIWWRKVVTSRIKRWKPARLLDVASGTGLFAVEQLAEELQDLLPWKVDLVTSGAARDRMAHVLAEAVEL